MFNLINVCGSCQKKHGANFMSIKRGRYIIYIKLVSSGRMKKGDA